MTEEGMVWLGECFTAYYENCVALKAIRNEHPEDCEQGLR